MALIYQITCTRCNTTLNSKSGVPAGQLVACPRCNANFKVAPAEDTEIVENFEKEDQAHAPQEKAAENQVVAQEEAIKKRPREEEEEKPRAKKRPRDEDGYENEEKPKPRRKKKSAVDDEDDAPKSRRSRDEDDDDDFPRRKKKKRRRDDDDVYRSTNRGLWIRVGVLVVLLGIAGVLGYMVYHKKKKEPANINHQPDIVSPTDVEPENKHPAVDLGAKKLAQLEMLDVDGKKVTLSGAGLETKPYILAPNAKIIVNGQPAKLDDLRSRTQVLYTMDENKQVTVIDQDQ
jgi:hypothetical protein